MIRACLKYREVGIVYDGCREDPVKERADMKKKIITLFICCAAVAGIGIFTGCGGSDRSDKTDRADTAADLMADISANQVQADADLKGPGRTAVTDFAVRLLQNMPSEDNTLLSPLSILCALGMTQNGAGGETLGQMEQALGMPCEELDAYLYQYLHALPKSDRYKLCAANSIWLRADEGLFVEPAFLQTNADQYGADIYEDSFDDGSVKRINGWVKEHTDDMIDGIISEIPADAVMYLVNALAFDAEWESIYNEDQVRADVFTKEDGTQQSVDLMYSEEFGFLRDTHASGFLKYYADEEYAFAALLPDEGTDVAEYAASLTGERLQAILQDVQDQTVFAAIPKFTCTYSVDLSAILQAMGMEDAFDPERADFSGIGSYAEDRIYIDKVAHKTFMAVDERGTRAGAVTAVEMAARGAVMEGETVYLDRPFVYMLLDCEAKVPVFIGVVRDVEQ